MLKALNKKLPAIIKKKLNQMIQNLYEAKSNQMKKFLGDIKWFSIIRDGWKDLINYLIQVKPYIGHRVS